MFLISVLIRTDLIEKYLLSCYFYYVTYLLLWSMLWNKEGLKVLNKIIIMSGLKSDEEVNKFVSVLGKAFENSVPSIYVTYRVEGYDVEVEVQDAKRGKNIIKECIAKYRATLVPSG